MTLFRVCVVAVFIVLSGIYNQNAFASGSGGYRIETPDAGAMGMGSAFVGEADTPAAVYYNPAGINQISTPEITAGDALIAPRGSMKTTDGDETIKMRNYEYNIPNFYAVIPIKPNKLSIGVGSGSYWGTGTDWGNNSDLQYASTKANISNIDNSLVVAYQVTDQLSLAASVDNDYSKADENFNFANPVVGPNGGVNLKATDDSWGYRIASLFKINDQNQFGLMYRSRVNHNYVGDVNIDGVGSVYHNSYGVPLSFQTEAEVKTVLPQSVIFGYSFKPTTKWTINADLEWMDWSSYKNESFRYPDANANELTLLNQLPNPIAENWKSVLSESIGTQYAITDSFRVRAGYYHHRTPVPAATFNPILPDSSTNAFTVGFGYDLTKHLTIDMAYSGEIFETRSVTNDLPSTNVSLANGSGVSGKYSEYVNIGLVSLTYKF